jgi:TRAP-type C4-dicarboxylate transport system permease small subunit
MTASATEGGRRARGLVARAFRVASYLDEAMAHMGMAFVLLFMVLEIIEIVGRRAFGLSILGLGEIGQLLVMSCICFVLPFAFIREHHVAVEFATDPLPKRALALLKALVAMVSAVFVIALAYCGFGQGWGQVAKGDVSPTLAIPIAWYWIPLLIGISVSGLSCLLLVVVHLRDASSSKADARAEPDHTSGSGQGAA